MRLLALALILAASGTAADSPFFKPGKARILILSGRNNHDWRSTTPRLKQILEATGRFDVRVTEEPGGLTTASLAPYDAILSDYNGPRWGEVAERAVEEFVRAGKGLMAYHAAAYAFGDMDILGDNHVHTGVHEAPWAAYARMIGATWSGLDPKTGHGDRHLFRVKWANRAHPLAAPGEDAFSISDELYHNFRMQPGIHLLATAFDAPDKRGTGKDEPIAWTVAYGQGRVFYTALGHDTAAMSSPGFVGLMQRAAYWAANVKPVDAPELKPIRVTVVTGGHDYEPSFYSVFDNAPGLAVRVNPHPIAYRSDIRKSCDVLVTYDMVQELPDAQKANLRNFLESGKGAVILHHALAGYQDWEWYWREVVGARYLLKAENGLPASTYLHDVPLEVQPVQAHPVLRGIPAMTIEDETYKQMWFAPDLKVLLRTAHPTSDGPVAWISPYTKSRVVVIQLGHGSAAHRHPSYQQLVKNAIQWAAGR